MASVLIIDEHEDSRQMLSRAFQKVGVTVSSAPNGADALGELVKSVPDVIVLDMMMSEMNGVEFLQIIRSYLRWASVPVVVVTGYPTGPHIDKARKLGVRHFYQKAAFSIEDLVNCVTELARDPGFGCSGGIGA